MWFAVFGYVALARVEIKVRYLHLLQVVDCYRNIPVGIKAKTWVSLILY